jgi:hypothetical protein
METNVTPLEKQVIENILKSEYMDYQNPENVINYGVWSFSVTNSRKDLAGAIGSLVKKELVFSDDSDTDEICGLTKKGYEYAKSQNLL